MKRKELWTAAGLVAAALVALFALRRGPGGPPPGNLQQPGVQAAAIDEAASRPIPLSSELKILPPEIRPQVESALREAGAQRVRVASLDARDARGRDNLQWLFTPPGEGAPEWQREAWDRHMAPLLYPPGHPREGQWRDSVSPEDVEAAAMPIAEKFLPADYLDQPMLYVPQKRINFHELNQAAASLWPEQDPAAARPFYEWLKAAPEDPGAYPSDFWLPAPPGDPEATTHRAWLAEQIRKQAAEQIAAQQQGS